MRTAVNDAIAAITATILRESPFGDVAVAVVNVQEGTGPDDQPYLHFVVSAPTPIRSAEHGPEKGCSHSVRA